MTDYWRKRLEGQTYDLIRFRNGYASDAPTMDVEFRGLDLGEWDGQIVYAIALGAIIALENCECLTPPRPYPPKSSVSSPA